MRSGALITVLLAASLLAGGCSRAIGGTATAEPEIVRGEVDTSVVRGAVDSEADRLAAAAILDIQAFWRQRFPQEHQRPWEDLRGGFYSVDTADPQATPPPCTVDIAVMEGNAYYCPEADVMAYDRGSLLPVLSEEFGDAAVVVVLAHEMGHAVHHRLGLDFTQQYAEPEKFPTILFEVKADCYSGAFIRWVADGHSPHLTITPHQLDRALGALVTLRDPVGTDSENSSAHGNAFDRVSSFEDGYRHGTRPCDEMTVRNRQFTQTNFNSAADEARGGNLPYQQLIDAIRPDLERYFGNIARRNGGRWQPPQLRPTANEPSCGVDQGPAAFCAEAAPPAGAIELDPGGELRALHEEFGDYATGILLASRYALAVQGSLGMPTDDAAAGRTALCLAGSYTGELMNRQQGFGLSPGDLDEAVFLLLRDDYASRDVTGEAPAVPGFDRVSTFRHGAQQGPQSCGLG